MFPLERQKRIIELLMVKKVLKMTELTSELGISVDTLRRDIQTLTNEGKIEKIYGGVKLVESFLGESTMGERMVSHLTEKESIALTCSNLINDGDCIFLDSGSTTYQIAKYIKNKKNLTVVTNSIPIITELMTSDVELIVIGGKIRKEENSVVTFDYLFNFQELNIYKAFICTSGITLEKGISDYNLEEVLTRKKMIEISKEIYVAADSSKFGKDVTVSIAPLESIDYIITDANLSDSIVEQFRETNCTLILAENTEK
ncbi:MULTISPECIES: DeoR/GlpR family DNA-binding transcription regulator [Bacillaceae]|uniref:DeoR/GlpR family DNA-binding transcription regulator n=1 Tax=Bacillaceae TaxID=186817 RepID=UPI001E5C4D4B|nr:MULTISPECIES: DeoR/GlpR family DNA-binding transcription regulator [Bacillaceae]MCE4048728.1 DeoR/GlpR family DNA-binding transcription regulator [Bacillus sp. Au-Bac7]MCM3032862.1 DeoR/GlpR family DNA-binding transcription regulator [Niallia sp. MER 6]